MFIPLTQRTSTLVGLFAIGLLAGCNGGGKLPANLVTPPPAGPGEFGDFAFELRQDVKIGGLMLTGTVFQDLNGDGFMDVAELSSFSNELQIGRGLADGTFIQIGVLSTPAFPWSIASGDFNGDGALDLVVGCLSDPDAVGEPSGGVLAFYSQDAAGDFDLVSTTPLAGDPLSMTRLWEGGNDFDAKGKDDLLVGLRGANVVQQLRHELGVWTLMAQLSPLSGGLSNASPFTVTAMDIDGDTDLDVVVGEFSVVAEPDRVVAYSNDGLGGFLPASLVLPFLDSPIVKGQGDVDGDGFEDLAISELGGSNAILLHGSSDGLLAIDTAEFGGAISGSVWGDFDGDGVVDVAATRINDQAIGVRYGIAPGISGTLNMSFGLPTFYNVGGGPHDLTLVNVSQDGLVDLVCANSGDISILHNRGNREFLAAKGYLIGGKPAHVVTGDLDQNGTVDIVTLDLYQERVVFFSGQGDSTFVRTAEVSLELSGSPTPGFVVVRDFDEDGFSDVLVTVLESDDVHLIRNPGSMAFGPPAVGDKTAVGDRPLGVDSADFDGDEHWDVLVANSADSSLQMLIGAGDGSFSAQTPMVLDGEVMAVYAGDINGDGKADAVVTMAEADNSQPRLKLFEGDGNGNLTDRATFPLGAYSSAIEVGDLDADGLVDLVFGQSTVFTDEVTILINQGGFSFLSSTLVVGADPGSLTIADVDMDGDLDLVVPIGAGELRLALGDGTGAFPEVVPLEGADFTLPVPFGTNASTFADVDGDGLADLIMLSPKTSYLWVARNLGNGGLK